uniref:Glycoside hydrolase family 3 N-terminal domain-containing protein n=1 Tax=Amphimedon queenslandica TaxID=400682 RepID=A0A1X7UPQ3_AMPQE
MELLLVFSLVFSSLALGNSYVPEFPFRDPSLPIEERVKDIVDRLTLAQLVEQMAHGGAGNNGPAPGIPDLNIKPYQWGTECLSGDVGAGDATSFPMSIGMAATFNYDLLKQVSNATAYEVRAKNTAAVLNGSYAFHTGLSCWSPVLNIMRDPRWGRNQETYGEDPYLSSYLGQAFVTGLQGDDPTYVIANAGCKHFDVHGGPEDTPVPRFSFDANVTMRDWRMTFLPQFKACVEAGALSLMCSYNRINGVPACANKKLLTDILRNEWNFKGYVVSDQGALENIVTQHHYAPDFVTAAAEAANAGTCLEDGNSEDKDGNVFENLDDAVEKGLVSVDTLKDAVSRLFYVRTKLGEFDPPDNNNPYANIPLSIIQSDTHIKIALQAAMESIVLMKNEFNGSPFLPLLPLANKFKRACVVGPFIKNPDTMFGDYSPTMMGLQGRI